MFENGELDNLSLEALKVAPIPLFMLNKHGRVILWNHACENITGIKAEQILQTDHHWQVFYPHAPEQRPTLADLLLTDRQDRLTEYYPHEQNPHSWGDCLQAENWFSQMGGKKRYMIFTATKVKNKSGELVAVIETFQDISKRQHAEEKMKALLHQVSEGKRQWEETMDCIRDLVLIIDAEGKIKRCNHMVTELASCPYKDVLNQDWLQLLQQAGMDFTSQRGQEGEICHPATQRWFSLQKFRFRNRSENSQWSVIVLYDLTESRRVAIELERAYTDLKNTQGQMLQNEKMASIGQLAAGVAHEINNPIGFVSSNLNSLGKYVERLNSFIDRQGQLIEKYVTADDKQELKQLRKKLKIDFLLEDTEQLLDESLEGTQRVQKIVQNLKTFSRLDESESKAVDLNECLESTLNIVWNELKYKARIEKELTEIPLVTCYPQQINQVFLNLLVNAGHAIDEQGTIRLRSWQEENMVCIAVSDTGCGIPEKNLNRLFEPFFTTKEVGKGTGLGLSISYDIIRKHGGDILVQSELGRGTTFTVQLPVNATDG